MPRRIKSITTPALMEQWHQYHRTRCPEIRGRLVVAYGQLVLQLALKISTRLPVSVELDDLTSVGTVGLLKGIDRYDPNRGTKPEGYLSTRIYGEIIDDLRGIDLLPRNQRKQIKREEAARATLMMELERQPTFEELTERLGTTPHLAGEYADPASRPVYSLDYEIDERGEDAQADIMVQFREADPLVAAARAEHHPTLLDELTDVERDVIQRLFYRNESWGHIARAYGVSESRIYQHRRTALAKIHAGRSYHQMRELLVA